jgi:hypothetical protein
MTTTTTAWNVSGTGSATTSSSPDWWLLIILVALGCVALGSALGRRRKSE